jgi:hypothetical protein
VLNGYSPGAQGVLNGYSRGTHRGTLGEFDWGEGRRWEGRGREEGLHRAGKGGSESYGAGRGSPAARLDVRESEEHPRKPASRPKREGAKRESAKWESAKWESAKRESGQAGER